LEVEMELHLPAESMDQISPSPVLLRARTTARAAAADDVRCDAGVGATAVAGTTLTGDCSDAVGAGVATPVQAPAISEALATAAARPILAPTLLMILPFPK
jgi:hypothetical protein